MLDKFQAEKDNGRYHKYHRIIVKRLKDQHKCQLRLQHPYERQVPQRLNKIPASTTQCSLKCSDVQPTG